MLLAFLKCGVRCVAANLWSVYDEAALALGLLFFDEMCQGRSIAASASWAQRALAEGQVATLEDLPNSKR